MIDAKVISINPSKKTTGELHSEFLEKMARKCRPASLPMMHFKTFVNLMFGINRHTSKTDSTKYLIFRLLIAGCLIIHTVLNTNYAITVPITTWIAIAVSISLVFGIFSRMTAFSISAICVLTICMSSGGENQDLIIGSLSIPFYEICVYAILMFFTAFFGPGKWSIDNLIRKTILRIATGIQNRRSVSRKQKLAKDRLSYRAFSISE